MCKSNLVMSLGASYKYHHLEPLFRSLKHTGYSDHFVFFYDDLAGSTIEKLKRFGFTLIPYTCSYPYVKDPIIEQYLADQPDFTPHPKTLRYFLYNAYLRAYRNTYQNVFIGDCRDLVFQKQPFDDFMLEGLHCFAEDNSQSIGSNQFNSQWIREAFGEEVLNQIANKPIICSGTTYGNIESMVDYTNLMIEQIKRVKDRGCKDQGIHNYLIHTGKISDVSIHSDDSGSVSTLSTFKAYDKIKLNQEMNVLDLNGSVIPIVHQYDRHWKLLWKHNKRDYFEKRKNLVKQFLLAVSKQGLKKSYLTNLRMIFTEKMLRKYDWN